MSVSLGVLVCVVLSLVFVSAGCKKQCVKSTSSEVSQSDKDIPKKQKNYPDTDAEVKLLIKKGMTKEEVETVIGTEYILSNFESFEKMNYYFHTDPNESVKEGSLVGVSVYLKEGLVEYWKGSYFGGTVEH